MYAVLVLLLLALPLGGLGFFIHPSPVLGRASAFSSKRLRRLGGVSSDVDPSKAYVKQSDVMIVVPLLKLKLEILPSLQGNLPGNAKSAVLSKRSLIEALDSSPYVQAVPDLSDSTHLAIFAKGEQDSAAAKEAVFKWWKQLGDDRPSNILLCFKTHYLNLQYESTAEEEEGGSEVE